ncbi:MAG: hypothetical protein CMH83_01675 [Nocardioides sp.]|nr:hypothetical protein [Nocardioides sp.]
MIDWIEGRSATELVLLGLGILLVLTIGSAFLARYLVHRGMQTPWVVDLFNGLAERAVAVIKRPLTIVVLDEVADVIQTGHYTQNVSDALIENRAELKAMVAEKIREDPNASLIRRLPGYDKVVDEVSETTLRVIVEVLHDPRTDELVSDLLRNNLQQIRKAVRERQHEDVQLRGPDASAPQRQHHAAAEAAIRRARRSR